MAFEARDLMIDVFPDQAVFLAKRCTDASPPPKPAPCLPPSCARNSAKAMDFAEESPRLAPMAVFREQLRQALRS
jgi:hypothetical protein